MVWAYFGFHLHLWGTQLSIVGFAFASIGPIIVTSFNIFFIVPISLISFALYHIIICPWFSTKRCILFFLNVFLLQGLGRFRPSWKRFLWGLNFWSAPLGRYLTVHASPAGIFVLIWRSRTGCNSVKLLMCIHFINQCLRCALFS